MYDYLIFTHIPSFYKVNLYNELSKDLNIYVVFISETTQEKRADGFLNLENSNFAYSVLNKSDFQKRNVFSSIMKVKYFLDHIEYKNILVGGWDLPEFWFFSFFSKKVKNNLTLESTIYESQCNGYKGIFKKIFLSRMKKVFASGSLHKELLTKLNFKGYIKITKGVGIINKPFFSDKQEIYNDRFLYIGRIIEVKNLKVLIEVFNSLPEKKLTIIGDGDQLDFLKSISRKNINFLNPISNASLADVYLAHDVFILPSLSEPWGLVAEEALYFGLPVIISKFCGASELIVDGANGFVFSPDHTNELKNKILSCSLNRFQLNSNASNIIDVKDIIQVSSYKV